MTQSVRAVRAAFALGLTTFLAAQCGPGPATDVGAVRGYESPQYGWSVRAPEGWEIDAADPAFVRMRPQDGNALCGIQTADVPFDNPDDLTDFIQDFTAREARRAGLAARETSRENIRTPSGAPGIRVSTELEPGGRSVRAYFVANGNGIVVDCEARVGDWDAVGDEIDEILSSFTFGAV